MPAREKRIDASSSGDGRLWDGRHGRGSRAGCRESEGPREQSQRGLYHEGYVFI